MVVAVCTVRETNGATGSEADTNITNTIWSSSDTVNIADPATSPITAASGGASFEKWQRMYFDFDTSTSVDNFRVYLSTYEVVANCTLVTSASTSAYTSPVYATPAANTDEAGWNMPIVLGTANINVTGSDLTTSLVADGYSQYVVHVVAVGASATAGPTTAWQMSWLYDEVT